MYFPKCIQNEHSGSIVLVFHGGSCLFCYDVYRVFLFLFKVRPLYYNEYKRMGCFSFGHGVKRSEGHETFISRR